MLTFTTAASCPVGSATSAPAVVFDAPQSDAGAWEQAGRAWRDERARVDAGRGRIALVNAVLSAVKRFDCDLTSEDDLADALHCAVRRFVGSAR